jgi:cytochrome c oxidase cbb3-type subunit 3
MTTFWSVWVKSLVVLNLGITFFLYLWAQRVKVPTLSDGTTGHVWAHGVLREGVRKLPLWWVVFSGSVFLWGFVYLVLYPGFGSFKGVLGWTSEQQLQEQMLANDARQQPVLQRVRTASIEALAGDTQVTAVGHTLFQENCAACHGGDARGNTWLGAPNLVDDDWVYGGDGATILASILDGRNGIMPPWGGVLGRDGVNEVTAYVLSLSGHKAPEDWVAAGKARYATVCVACHGADARGNPTLGAPNLTDDIWVYGKDFARVAETVRDGRNGVMPAWRERLGEDRARIIAAWVYAQSGDSQARPDQRPRPPGT